MQTDITVRDNDEGASFKWNFGNDIYLLRENHSETMNSVKDIVLKGSNKAFRETKHFQ